MKTTKIHRELKLHRVPCGPTSINASAVCRRRLRDTFDRLLDKVCEECHQEWQEPQLPEGHKLTDDGRVMSAEHLKKQAKTTEKVKATKEEKAAQPTREQMKKEMLEKEKLKAEVKLEAQKYKEKLQGNSKLLQDTSGKIEKR